MKFMEYVKFVKTTRFSSLSINHNITYPLKYHNTVFFFAIGKIPIGDYMSALLMC